MSEIERKTIRLQQAYYLGFRSYFVTICAKDRKKLFVSSAIVECLLNVLRVQAERFRFDIYAYCFMPDHCHLLVRGKTPGANLSEIIRGFKGGSAKNLRQFSSSMRGRRVFMSISCDPTRIAGRRRLIFSKIPCVQGWRKIFMSGHSRDRLYLTGESFGRQIGNLCRRIGRR